MRKYFILPYSMKSMSARLLARTLNATIFINRGDKPALYNPLNDVVINWGCASQRRNIIDTYNSYNAVRLASNKLHSYKVFQEEGISTVQWTTDFNRAKIWLAENQKVFARNLTNGHGGKGTTVISPDQELPESVFYTLHFPVHREFRVHVINNNSILVQEKKKKRDFQNHNPFIRNHNNGWIFCKNNLDVYPDTLKTTAVNAVKALKLDFGAVDIALDKYDNICVFEVNTAPGLTPSTAELYKQHFTQ